MGNLNGQTIIITGAAGGIGSAIALRCLRDGATGLGLDRDRIALGHLQEDAQIDKLSTFPVDLSLYNEVEALYKKIGQTILASFLLTGVVFVQKSRPTERVLFRRASSSFIAFFWLRVVSASKQISRSPACQ